ncbi:MAG: hypothetical protein F6K58_09935, partial [Symploca sp. SIO2E9]|nr:hypothetical protein [Symploca sp. SIO2E9]
LSKQSVQWLRGSGEGEVRERGRGGDAEINFLPPASCLLSPAFPGEREVGWERSFLNLQSYQICVDQG